MAFAVHAAGSPPTNGLDVLNPAASGRGYIDGAYASVGTGETVAVVGIAVALAGAVLGLWPRRR